MKNIKLFKKQAVITLGLLDENELLNKENNRLQRELNVASHRFKIANESRTKYEKMLEKLTIEGFSLCSGCGRLPPEKEISDE